MGRRGSGRHRGGPCHRTERAEAGEQFAYVFDVGDGWDRLCTVAEKRSASTPSMNSARYRTGPFPIGLSAASPTSTHSAGTGTVGSRPCRSGQVAGSVICRGGAEDDLTLHTGGGREREVQPAAGPPPARQPLTQAGAPHASSGTLSCTGECGGSALSARLPSARTARSRAGSPEVRVAVGWWGRRGEAARNSGTWG